MRVAASDPGAHQFLLALDHSQRCFVGLAVLPASVPVSRLLGEVVAFPSVEQPVLWAGHLTLDAALGSCREGEGAECLQECLATAMFPVCLVTAVSPGLFPRLPPSVWTSVPFRDTAEVTVPQGGVPDEMNIRRHCTARWSVCYHGGSRGTNPSKDLPLSPRNSDQKGPEIHISVARVGDPGRTVCLFITTHSLSS